MSNPDQNIPELDGLLAKAANEVRDDNISDDLVARCRASALAIEDNTVELLQPSRNRHWVAEWVGPMTAAAVVLVALNVGQAVARMPSADRQIAAILELSDGQRHLLYSDRIIEPVLTTQQSE